MNGIISVIRVIYHKTWKKYTSRRIYVNIPTTNVSGGMIADLACLAIITIFAISNWSKGFISQVFKVICTLGALILAYLFCESFTNVLNQNFNLDDNISQKIQSLFGQGTTYLAQLTEENLQTAIKELKLPDFIADFALSNINVNTFDNIGEYLANVITHYIILAISYTIIFIIAKIALTLSSKLLLKIVKLPLIRSVDRLLGLIWGLIKAALLVFTIICFIEIMPGELFINAKTAIESSLFVSLLQKFNPITLAISWIATQINL